MTMEQANTDCRPHFQSPPELLFVCPQLGHELTEKSWNDGGRE